MISFGAPFRASRFPRRGVLVAHPRSRPGHRGSLPGRAKGSGWLGPSPSCPTSNGCRRRLNRSGSPLCCSCFEPGGACWCWTIPRRCSSQANARAAIEQGWMATVNSGATADASARPPHSGPRHHNRLTRHVLRHRRRECEGTMFPGNRSILAWNLIPGAV